MKKQGIIVISFLLLSITGYSQTIKIQYFEPKEEAFTKAVSQFIDSRKEFEQDESDKKWYIKVDMVKEIPNDTTYFQEGFLAYISRGYDDLIDRPNDYYPHFYTYIKDKIVLVKMNEFNVVGYNFSEKTKRKLRRKIVKFLPKKQHVKVKDSTGEVVINDKNFRPELIDWSGEYLFISYEGDFRFHKPIYR